jgi:hypothetical protein
MDEVNATNVQSSERLLAAYYEAGRAVAACCLGIRFSRATVARDRGSIGTVETANLVVSEALSDAPLRRQQLIDRHMHSLLAGAIVAKRIAASSQGAVIKAALPPEPAFCVPERHGAGGK